ncbi:hypothetical protein [Solwaraspora sp. WMMA2065]|uniref:hypothetical protein n=1 Tax=Solwaraspora sp. WMMA2065 TaxID=3015166 RepID=UPI00259B877F|nr:hypothetical protein [Solwaraspora sp. WMMA2065]WJK34335.1 hypothetical protein O7610_27640 [Solwaraspora sp. WMMA2065]
MTDNRSARWTDPTLDPTQRNRDLFAVLDRADLSEPARAAVAHALGPEAGPAGHAEALVNRYLNERERRRPVTQVNGSSEGPGGIGNLPDWLRYDRRGRYTLHLTFAAVDVGTAREQAVAYAEGLAILCPELGEHAPLLSRAEAWNVNEPLFCGVRGPDGEVCAEVRHHPGFHRAAGLGGLCWGDGDSHANGTGDADGTLT